MRHWTWLFGMSMLLLLVMLMDLNSTLIAEADTGVRFMVVDAASGLSDVTVGSDGQAHIRIVAEGVRSVAGAQFHVAFSPSIIQVIADTVHAGNLGDGVFFQHKIDNAQGRLSIIFARPSPVGKNKFIVAEAKLTVNDWGDRCTPLSIRELIAVNGSAPPEQVSATVSDAAICVGQSGPVRLSIATVHGNDNEVDVPRGRSVKMNLVAENAAQLAGVQVTLKFDSRVANIQQGGVVIGPMFSQFVTSIRIDNDHGEVLLVAANARNLGVTSATIAEIEFLLLPTAIGCSNLSLEDVTVGDGSIPSKQIETELRNGRICVSESNGAPVEFKPARILASPGHVFSLDLWTNNEPAQEVTGVEVHVGFDPELLTVVNPATRASADQIQADLGQLPIVLANSVDNSEGTFVYSAGTLTKPHPKGALKLASVTFMINNDSPLDVETHVKFRFVPGATTKVSVSGESIDGMHRDASVEINSGLTGSVRLQGSSRPHEGYEVPVVVKFYPAGVQIGHLSTIAPLRTFEKETAVAQTPQGLSAEFFMSGVPLGEFDVTIDSEHTLMNIIRNVEIRPETRTLDFGVLAEGDADDDGVIDILDFTLLAQDFLKCENDVGFDERTDFDRSRCVNILDFTLFAQNFLRSSPIPAR
jgi:hypothetical protein